MSDFDDFKREARKINPNFDKLSSKQQRADFERYKEATASESIYDRASRLPGISQVLSAPRDTKVPYNLSTGSRTPKPKSDSKSSTTTTTAARSASPGVASASASAKDNPAVNGLLDQLDPATRALLEPLLSGGGATSDWPGELKDNSPIWSAGRLVRQGPTTPGDRHRPQALGSGDKPASFFLGQFYKMTPNERTQLQEQMLAGGFYGPGVKREDIQFGTPDARSYAAYVEVLTRAARYNASGEKKSPEQVIAEGTGSPTGVDTDSIPPISLSNPIDIRKNFRDTYIARVGRAPDDAAMAAFVETYHGLERPALEASRAAAVAGQGGEVIGAPSLENAAEDEIRRTRSAEEQAYQTITRMNDFYSMLDSPVQL